MLRFLPTSSSRLNLSRALPLWRSSLKRPQIGRRGRWCEHSCRSRSGSTAARWHSPSPLHIHAVGRRCFSSSSSGDDSSEPEVILYEKTPGRLALIKSGFGFACFHSAYWIWYAVDFVPTINAAQLPDLHIDPMIPTVGIFFACVIQGIFTGYPLVLVSKLSWRPASRQFSVYTHALPFIRPSSRPHTSRVGDIRLDASSHDARSITTVWGGRLQDFEGMLWLQKTATDKKQTWWSLPYYLMDMRGGPRQVVQPEILLEALLQPERMAGNDDRITTSSSPKTAAWKPKQQPRGGSTKRSSRRKRRQ